MDEQLILNRYRLIERLASGGSAEVWRARDEQLDREVAIKRLHPHLLPDEASRKRLVAEARAAAGLSHPVIVGVYDVDASGEAPALVMELVEGESLSARIERDGPMEPREAAVITADLAEALYHAHQRGVIHRDVKPGNVLLSSDGRTRLVDFGIAHSLAASAERLTQTGTVVGTLRAMAPEQLTGEPITPRTDLYGLGVVLHEALTGRPPYSATSPVGLVEAQRAGKLSLEGIDTALASVIAACLAYEPTDRPLHAGAVAAALRDWLAGDSAAALAMVVPSSRADSEAITMAMPQVVAADPIAPRAAPAVATAPSAPADRRSLRWPFVTAVALLALVLLGAAVFRAMESGPSQAGSAATSSADASPTTPPSPSPTPTPEWMTKLLEEVEKECGPDVASDLASQLAGLGEEEAKDAAHELIESCKDGGGQGGGNGNGRGGGNGRGDD